MPGPSEVDPLGEPVADDDMIGCHICGAQATCFGAYEDSEVPEPSCDEHCGHGNEDGRCFPLGELPQRYLELLAQLAVLEKVVGDKMNGDPLVQRALEILELSEKMKGESQCAFCGITSERNDAVMRAHILVCEKHPSAVLLKGLEAARLALDNTAAQAGLCVDKTGALPGQREWLRSAVQSEATIGFNAINEAILRVRGV